MAEQSLPTTLVIPTIGRPSLLVLLQTLQQDPGPRPAAVVVVDDRPAAEAAANPLALPPGLPVQVVRSGGLGPAGARNRGWRLARTPWVSFVDDDVLPEPDWLSRLAVDLDHAEDDVAGHQGKVAVPLPADRRPTDWERNTAGLATASYITADMTYRRAELVDVGGFDERFPRAFREDADLALRILGRGRRLTKGTRAVQHPVRPADFWVSVRTQRGNADDPLMTRLHGGDWWSRASAPRGRLRRHVAITAAGLTAGAALLLGRRRTAAVGAVLWGAGSAEFAWRRIAPGPRTADEVTRMTVTSLLIPPLASWHAARGRWQHRRAQPWRSLPDLVLFDRDGTLVHDVPYNADPTLVRPVDDAKRALDLLRERGVRVGIVTNQSGIASGKIRPDQATAVNAEVERLLGPFDVVLMCPHAPADGCDCRKPAPGLVKEACQRLGVPADRCVVVGDIGSDVEAASRAGASGILVPNGATAAGEVTRADLVRPSLLAAVEHLLQVS